MMRANTITAGPTATALVATFCLGITDVVSSGTPPSESSLKQKSNEELVALVTGEDKSTLRTTEDCSEDRVRPSPLDRLWEMPPRDAAVAFVSDYTSKEVTGVTLETDDPTAKPPASGEIGMRWISGNYYAAPQQGLTLLKYDGNNSVLLLSQVEIVGRPSKQEIEREVMRTDRYPLPRLVAQQTYEILWWLWRVRMVGEYRGGRSLTSSSVDDFGRLWMKPDGPTIEKASFGEPCGECFAAHDDRFMYETFVATLIRRLIKRSGIKPRNPVPKIGKHVDLDEDAKFLHTPPPDREDPKALKKWIGRLAEILRNPERQYLYDQIMETLVPISDPLRHEDRRIDEALLDLMHRGLDAKSKLKQFEETSKKNESIVAEIDSDKDPQDAKADQGRKKQRAEERTLRGLEFSGLEAAEKLGAHDAVRTFPELFALAKQNLDMEGFNRPLIAAAAIAGRHQEFQPQLAEYLKERLAHHDEQTSRGSPVLEAVWRADLRSLAPQLAQIAALPPPPPNPKDVRPSAVRKAYVILIAWRETDKLTKTKLDALLTGYLGGASYIPEVLHKEFAGLSPENQFKFREFITWMRTVDVGFSRFYLEKVFTPHTPRPDILFER